MSDQNLVSYAQNGEDVVLWRALGHVEGGRYVDVGACDPVELSVTKALYDRGWRGLDIDAVPAYAQRLREARPGNDVLQAAITDRGVSEVTFHELVGTGLSTLVDDAAQSAEDGGFTRRDIVVPAMTLDAACERSQVLGPELHVLKIDVEGAEAEVLRSIDLQRWRPWVVVVEATVPLTTEPAYEEWDPLLTAAGWVFTLFDGLSRWYVSPDHPELVRDLSYPACVLDDYTPVDAYRSARRVQTLAAELTAADHEVSRWRGEAVGYWAEAVAAAQASKDDADDAKAEAARLRSQLEKTRARLEEVRQERKRLRARLRKLSGGAETTPAAPGGPAGAEDGGSGRLRAVARRIRPS